MRRHWFLVLLLLLAAQSGEASVDLDTSDWTRIDSHYCTIYLDQGIDIKKVNRRISTRWIRLGMKFEKGETPESELAAKCDTIFRRTLEILDMFPPGIHVTVKITDDGGKLKKLHRDSYGHSTDAVAFYLFNTNTIYAVFSDISESVLVHEIAHCVIDHYFQIRPPRKIEEMLAMYADAHLRD